MSFKALYKASWLLLLSILLTCVSSFGEASSPSREAYVQAAYEEFHNLIYFLSGNDRFLQSLTAEEKAQFLLVGDSLIKHVVIWGPAAQPGQYKTSSRVDFKLLFSDKNEDFILNPNEPARTAKMAGDIWFNLNVVNNPKTTFGLLEAFQILFHEFGHKVGEKKDQVLIDSVAAKMRQHLTSYHRETVLGPNLKVSSLIIPYISFARQPVDYQFEPIVIIDNESKAATARLNVAGEVLASGIGFLENPRSQVYTRTLFNPKFLPDAGGIRIEWQVSNRHSFVVMKPGGGYNYINLYTNLEKAKVDEKLEPVMEYKRYIQTISPSDLSGIARGEYSNADVPMRGINNEFLPYTPSNEKSRWLSNLKETGTTGKRVVYSALIESETPVKSVRLLGSHDDVFFKFAGEVRSFGNNVYELNFSLPAESSVDGPMTFTGVILNDQEKWDLPVLEKRILRATQPLRQPRPNVIGLKNEAGQMVMVQDVRVDAMPTDQIVWRLGFKDPNVQLEQIEIMWLMPETIEKDGVNLGERVRSVHEVIDAKDLRQEVIAGVKIVEFTSKEASKVLASSKMSEGYTTKDSLLRYMRVLQITDTSYGTYATHQINLPSGWKSSFELRPKTNSAAVSCNKVFEFSR